jgi:Flp pilus assembly protein TadG
MKGLLSRFTDESGAAIALVALSMVAFLSAVALAVDVGMLVSARAEAQRSADSAALAGAAMLALDPKGEAVARAEAKTYAGFNSIRGQVPALLDEDITVDLAKSWVTVSVRRTADRGTAIPTFFARVFGVDAVNISATATAEASDAPTESGAQCLLPVMLPDRWSEDGLNVGSQYWPKANDSFDPPPVPKSAKDKTPDGYDAKITGYGADVIGTQMEIHKSGGGGGGMNPSWYFPWAPVDDVDQQLDGGAGASKFEARFTTCLKATYLPGDFINTEPGAMVQPTNRGFDDIYNSDTEMIWNPTANDGKGCPYRPSTKACDYTTPRIRPMPMFDPTQAPKSGRKEVQITQFAQIFYEGNTGNSGNPAFMARFLGYVTPDPGGNDTGGGGGPVEGPIVKKLRLVK